jgi:hypothetical protein
LHTRCNPKNDRKLCRGGLACGHVPELGGTRCCRWRYFACEADADCCANLQCLGADDGRSCDIAT